MRKVNISIAIDSNSRSLKYCLLEDRDLNPRTHFKFKQGYWFAEFDDFPLGPDNDLDILIIASGNPGTASEMTVWINKEKKGTYNLFKPFNRNGYGQFNEEISL